MQKRAPAVAILVSLTAALASFLSFLPGLVGAILLLIVGWVVASALARLQVHYPFGISRQPSNAMVGEGSTFSCSIAVTGAPAPAFQWYFNGQPLAGRTASILTISNVQPADAGDYWATAANACATETSQVARLEVVPPGSTFTRITEGPTPTSAAIPPGAP